MQDSFENHCPHAKLNSLRSTVTPCVGLTESQFPDSDLQRKKAGFDGVQRLDIVPMDSADWFRFDGERLPLLKQKDQLLESVPIHTYLTLPRAEAGACELLEKISNWVCKHQPEYFERRDDNLYDRTTGKLHSLDSKDALRTAAMIVAEDLVLLNRDSDGRYRLVAGCVCFPSNWSLTEKLNKTVAEIHSPVPELNQRIGAKIDLFLERMKPERPQARSNFLINFDPELSQIPSVYAGGPSNHPKLTKENIGEVLWLRSERETFTKLPQSENIVFTLRTYQMRVNEISSATAKVIAELHRTIPEQYRDHYRKLDTQEHQILVEYLEHRAQLGIV